MGPFFCKSTCEKDLGILVDNRLRMSQQCAAAAKRAKVHSSCIKEICIVLRSWELIVLLVRPHQFWPLTIKKDVEELEIMQRRTNMVRIWMLNNIRCIVYKLYSLEWTCYHPLWTLLDTPKNFFYIFPLTFWQVLGSTYSRKRECSIFGMVYS